MLGPPPLESPVERLGVAVEAVEAVEVAELGVEVVKIEEVVKAVGLGVEVEELPSERELWLFSDTEVLGSADRPAPPLRV